LTGNLPTKEVIKEVKHKSTQYLGGFLDLRQKKLSNEKTVSDKLLDANEEWVYINNHTLATEVSKVEFELYRTRMRAGEIELVKIDEHPVLDLLDRFNDTTTKAEGIYTLESHINLAGDSFLLLDEPTNPQNLFTLNPANIELILGDFTDNSRQLVDGYLYKDTIDGKSVEMKYSPEQVIQIKEPNPKNPYRGLSKVEVVAKTIDTDVMSRESLRQFFLSGMIGDFALTTDQRITDEQLKKMKSELRAAHTGVGNAWNIPIFSGGLKPESLQRNAKEMQLIELQKWLRDIIMAAFGNSKSALGITEDVNRANAEASIALWKQSTVKSHIGRIVDSLNEFLVPQFSEDLILGFVDPVPEDESAKIDKAIRLKSSDVITRNEAREMLELDPTQGGDEFASDRAERVSNENQLPKSIQNVNYKRHFRKTKLYTQKREHQIAVRKARPYAEKIVRSRRKKQAREEIRQHAIFTNDQVWGYWSKQIDHVEAQEKRLQNVIEQQTKEIVAEGLSNIDKPENRKSSDLVDVEARKLRIAEASIPILFEVLVASGQEAQKLVGSENPYVPKHQKELDIRKELMKQILLFANSMIASRVDEMTDILASGLAEGKSIPKIKREITEQFVEITPRIAERIVRTEVIRASNLGAQDVFEQTPGVVAKQWLTAEDDRVDSLCAPMNGKIVQLKGDYNGFLKGIMNDKQYQNMVDYQGTTQYPPLHPNCRCIILPIFTGEGEFTGEKQADNLKEQIKNMELLKKEDREYIRELEKVLGVDNE